MGKKIKRIFAGLCIILGIALMAVPLYCHFHGQNETDRLIEQFEKDLTDNEDETKGTNRFICRCIPVKEAGEMNE